MDVNAKVKICFSLVAVLYANTLYAQEPAVEAGSETVVTAARIAQKLSNTLRSVTVINATDIAESGQQTLTEVLQKFGGVEISSNGGFGQASSVFIRGANSNHTLVLIDGLRLSSATLGTTAFENIPLSQIERIEIVPGPVSGLYGSDAIGGVIQIFTRSGRYSPGISVTAGLGSYGSKSLSAAFASNVDNTDFTLSAGYFDTDGYNVTRPTISFGRFNPDEDGYRNANFSAKVTHRFNPQNELGATAFYSRGDTQFDNGPTTDDAIDLTLSAYSLFSQNQIAANWQMLTRLGTSRDESVSQGAFPSEFQTEQDQLTWQNTFTLGDGSLLAGAEYLKQKVSSPDTVFAVTSRTIKSVFAGFSGDYGNHGVQLNLRGDKNSQFGSPTTGSLAYGYRLTPALKVRASYGTAFHAPTFNELYFPADPFFGGGGNRDLQPERSRNGEIGVDYQTGQQRFAATYFDNRISDFIASDAMFVPQNIAKARIRGSEFSYQGNFAATQLRVKLSVQDPEDKKTGLQLQRRARKHGSIAASRAFGAWKVGADLIASGERFDSADENPASRLAGYTVVNLFVTRNVSPEWWVEVRWNNVTDKDYELAQGYQPFDSNVFATLKWTPAR